MTKNKRFYFKLFMHDNVVLSAIKTWATYEEAESSAKTTHIALGSRFYKIVEYDF